MVRATGLEYSYADGRKALCGIDLGVSAGECVGIMGPNGSGKSTLVRLLAGSLRAKSGSIEIGPPPARIAVVLDDLAFQESLGGLENARRTLLLRGVDGHVASAAAVGWVRAFGLEERAADPVSEYSSGMRRRLALAEALAADPVLLLLDEPTLGLDVGGRATLGRVLAEALQRGCAVMLASNEPGFVADCSHEVLLLHEGRIVASGDPCDLVSGLGRPVVISVDVNRSLEGGAIDGLPPGVEMLPASGITLRFTSEAGTGVLPSLCEWVAARDRDVRAIRVREPDLGDVFLSLTGVPVDAPAERRDQS